MATSEDPPADRLRERADQHRLPLWLLLEANRVTVTAILAAVVFLGLVAVGALVPAAEAAIRSGDSVDTLFQGLLTATVTGVTLVVTLNQVVLSQELGAVGDQRERMDAAVQFRTDVAEVLDVGVSPAEPSAFLRALVLEAGESAEQLKEAVGEREAASEVDVAAFTQSVIDNADGVAERLEGGRFGTFDVIASALDFNYSWKLVTARRVLEAQGESLDEAGRAALEDLIAVLERFGPAREHFKTLYFQWDLVDLSRHILVAAIPALLVSTSMLLFVEAGTYDVVLFQVETLVFFVAGAVTVSLVPFFVLLAYIMRIATVAKHTLSIGPFILRDGQE
jgi:hypothetical protein